MRCLLRLRCVRTLCSQSLMSLVCWRTHRPRPPFDLRRLWWLWRLGVLGLGVVGLVRVVHLLALPLLGVAAGSLALRTASRNVSGLTGSFFRSEALQGFSEIGAMSLVSQDRGDVWWSTGVFGNRGEPMLG